MQVANPPRIQPTTHQPFTRITFEPDDARFGMHGGLDPDALALLHRRVWDLAGTVGVQVELNGTVLPIRGFQSYVEQYLTYTDALGG